MGKRSPRDSDTAPHRPIVGSEPPPKVQVHIDFGAVSDRGTKRENNEDSYLVTRFGRALEAMLTNLPADDMPDRFRERGYALIVADGMGGHAAGEVASRLAIGTLVKRAMDMPDWVLKYDGEREKEAMRRADEYYRRVHEAVARRAEEDPNLRGMGTTMTVATILGHDGILAHVGDSRAYLHRDGELHQLTKDQTQAQLLLDSGVINEEEFARHQYRHVLLQAIGGKGGLVEVEIQRLRFLDNDRLLLCSDGLTDMVGDAAIAEVLSRSVSSQDACDLLVELALQAGGKDNVTVVLAHLNIPA
ncbi:MAG: serine/threonine-protein phosphatase [bacterium]|nr:serine/threonine-protein phosphatase [bacterium]